MRAMDMKTLGFFMTLAAPAAGAETAMLVYVGTYANGIYVLSLDEATGVLTSRGLAAETPDPSFLALDPGRRILFAVNETGRLDDAETGGVSAFSVQAGDGGLRFLGRQPSGGTYPCHITADASGRFVAVANYGSGSVAVFPVGKGGELGPARAHVQHRGHGSNPERQKGPHAHGVYFDRANRFLLVADLGLDQVLVYRFDAETGALQPNDPPFAPLEPGSGPRHLALAPDGRHVYCLNELRSTITVFAFDEKAGRLTALQTVGTLPPEAAGANSTAEIEVHPSGRFVYASNRGDDSVAVFAREAEGGRLTAVEFVPAGGRRPRGFALSPGGRLLLVGHQDADTVQVFRVDAETGRLTPVAPTVTVPRPVSFAFVSR